MFKIFAKIFLKKLYKQIQSEKFKNFLIKKVNEKVDIPKLTEEQEKKLITAVYDAIVAIIL